jgi:hypothetical protein
VPVWQRDLPEADYRRRLAEVGTAEEIRWVFLVVYSEANTFDDVKAAPRFCGGCIRGR